MKLKEFTEKIIREYLNEEIDTQKDLSEFLSDKKFINPNSKLFLYHGTKIPPEKFKLRDDYNWDDSHGWSGDLPEGYLFLTTNINEAKSYGQYVIPCELKRYDNKYFKVNANNPSQIFDKDYGIDLYMPDKYFGFWEKFEESGKRVLIIKGTDRWTVITDIENVIPRTDLAFEFYNNQSFNENISSNNFENGSVMIKDNTPIIFFHGTNNIFNEFTTKRRGVFGLGYYFTTDKNEAKGYGKNIMSVYLKIDNPASPKKVQELTTLIPDYKYLDDNELATEITNQLIKNGFDGVLFNYPNGDLLAMVINPNQIKIIENNQPLNENRSIEKLFNHDGHSVIIDDGYAHAELNLEPLEDGETSINISEIWSDVKGKGYATKLLNKLKRYSDKTGIPLSLRASTTNNIKTSGGLNQDELVNWYIKNGFKISEENNRFPSDSTAPFMIYNY